MALVLVTVAAGTMMIGSPALAEGEDPNTSGCSPATTVREFTAAKTGIRIELRYSDNCDGAWARSTQPGNARYGTAIFLQSTDGLLYTHQLGHGSQEWTPKANWTRTLRACYGWGWIGPAWNNYQSFECTSWW
ncbi:DUF2690 domain-containing protein [Micromonospora fulviviridis]|uniref:DUF2690 domain-containing protein n=1 Tax=Micromonospora fulviviridis TaxID=47860 RepID=UPI0037A8E0FF